MASLTKTFGGMLHNTTKRVRSLCRIRTNLYVSVINLLGGMVLPIRSCIESNVIIQYSKPSLLSQNAAILFYFLMIEFGPNEMYPFLAM